MTYKYNMPDELYHYGVLGMKWGVRKSDKYRGQNTRLKKLKTSKTADGHKGRRLTAKEVVDTGKKVAESAGILTLKASAAVAITTIRSYRYYYAVQFASSLAKIAIDDWANLIRPGK